MFKQHRNVSFNSGSVSEFLVGLETNLKLRVSTLESRIPPDDTSVQDNTAAPVQNATGNTY